MRKFLIRWWYTEDWQRTQYERMIRAFHPGNPFGVAMNPEFISLDEFVALRPGDTVWMDGREMRVLGWGNDGRRLDLVPVGGVPCEMKVVVQS